MLSDRDGCTWTLDPPTPFFFCFVYNIFPPAAIRGIPQERFHAFPDGTICDKRIPFTKRKGARNG